MWCLRTPVYEEEEEKAVGLETAKESQEELEGSLLLATCLLLLLIMFITVSHGQLQISQRCHCSVLHSLCFCTKNTNKSSLLEKYCKLHSKKFEKVRVTTGISLVK